MASAEKTILVTACGSSIGLEVLRSLDAARANNTNAGSERIIGTEVSWWGTQIAEQYCDEVIRVPRGDEPEYVDALNQTIANYGVDLAFINTDPEVESIAPVRDTFAIPLSCPTEPSLASCIDKRVLHEELSGTPFCAHTVTIRSIEDLEHADRSFDKPFWLRCATGPRGRGSILVEEIDEARFWIQYWRNRDKSDDVWLAHEFLPGRNFNWTSIWHEGSLIACCTGQRLKYFLSQVAVSGITGNVSNAVLVQSDYINETCMEAIERLDERATGIYSVDIKESFEDDPIITEINGRPAFRPYLYTTGGANFSRIFADLHLYGIKPADPFFDQDAQGWEIVRGMDHEPLFRKHEMTHREI